MSPEELAKVRFSVSDVEIIFDHIKSRKYRNMHLREKRTVKGKSTLRYLKMLTLKSDGKILGRVSGPTGLEAEFEIQKDGRVRFHLFDYSNEKEARSFLKNFSQRISRRVLQEINTPDEIRIQYAKGEFYLKRRSPGSKEDAKSVKIALKNKVLSPDFVRNLYGWNFLLLLGKGPRPKD